MLQRILSLSAALAVVVFVGSAVAADKDKDTGKSNSDSAVKGTLDKASADSITITDKNGKEHTMTVAKDATVTCDGKECKAADLKKGVMVKVTAKKDDKTVAEKIEAKSETDKDK